MIKAYKARPDRSKSRKHNPYSVEIISANIEAMIDSLNRSPVATPFASYISIL